jgi:hypothetical protein
MERVRHIPMEQWGNDHWSSLGYIETVMVDVGCFQIGSDPNMRFNQRNLDMLEESCPSPKRIGPQGRATEAMHPEDATLLKDGVQIDQHDDWNCIQDMALSGLFTISLEELQPGAKLRFSEKGQLLAAMLRQHKAAGDSLETFDPESAIRGLADRLANLFFGGRRK